jgi:UDP-N-acetylglucosamine 1-carboxyvinyltransferase
MTDDYLSRIGNLIRDARKHRGWTQTQLADVLGTSQSAVNRIEKGHQNLTLEMLARIGEALDSEIVSLGGGPVHLRVVGGRRLSGSIDVKSSKNAGVALLCATLLNKGRTTLRKVARIEEVNRLLEVLSSIGVRTTWLNDAGDLEIVPPADLDLSSMDAEAARRTRSIIMFLGPLLHREDTFALPYAGGCDLGTRTVEPHMAALRPFGLDVKAAGGEYHAVVNPAVSPTKPIVLTERGDTVTENALMAAARHDGVTVIRNASSNYMVQDLCFLSRPARGPDRRHRDHHAHRARPHRDRRGRRLRALGGPDRGDEPAHGGDRDRFGDHHPAGPDRVLEIELALLEEMGLDYSRSEEYLAENGRTRLVDLLTRPSQLHAPIDKIHPMPFPGLNIDNLPFFAAIAASATGQTMIHDWVYENRAIYLTDLNKLGASVKLLDPHRVMIEGPTHWSGAEIMCPPALRPAVVTLIAMMAAKGTSVLRSVYVIHRGYEDLATRLNSLGAQIETFRDI